MAKGKTKLKETARERSINAAANFIGRPLTIVEDDVVKSGRPLNCSPEELIIHFEAYRVEVKAAPYLVNGFMPSKFGADEVFYQKEKPLTLEGFSVYLFRKGILKNITMLFTNANDAYPQFLDAVAYIKMAIKMDQIEGGMAQVFSGNLTSRLNGLADNTKNENKNLNVNTNFDVEMDLS